MVLLRMTDFPDYIIAHRLIPLVNICSSIAFVLVNLSTAVAISPICVLTFSWISSHNILTYKWRLLSVWKQKQPISPWCTTHTSCVTTHARRPLEPWGQKCLQAATFRFLSLHPSTYCSLCSFCRACSCFRRLSLSWRMQRRNKLVNNEIRRCLHGKPW